MRTPAVTAALIATVAGFAAVPALAGTKSIKATSSDRWSKSSITVRKGDTVRFSWATGVPHNVRKTSGRGTVKNGAKIRNKGSATFKVPAKGTYKFICDVHPVTMKITVRAK